MSEGEQHGEVQQAVNPAVAGTAEGSAPAQNNVETNRSMVRANRHALRNAQKNRSAIRCRQRREDRFSTLRQTLGQFSHASTYGAVDSMPLHECRARLKAMIYGLRECEAAIDGERNTRVVLATADNIAVAQAIEDGFPDLFDTPGSPERPRGLPPLPAHPQMFSPASTDPGSYTPYTPQQPYAVRKII
jgi:hypothetical protein